MGLKEENEDKFGKVAVLYGGHSSERDISLITGKAVHEALLNCTVDSHLIDTRDGFIDQLVQDDFKSAWIALHGSDGEDGKIQSILNLLGIKYTGANTLSCSMTMNKLFSKNILISNGFQTPDFVLIDDEKDYEFIERRLETPFVMKPCSQGSSIGVFIIKEKKDFKEKLKELLQFNDWIIAEKYYKGSEYTAGLLNGEVLPLVKINASNEEFYNYEAKYFSEDTTYICPSQLDQSIESIIKETCLNVFNLFNINSWGRLDFFINDDNQPVFLELNTVPGMTSHSLVPMAAKEVGINFDNLCLEILRTSID